jgi:hypothetical protein
MRKNPVGVATLAVALSSVSFLYSGYAGAGEVASAELQVPDHALIQRPVHISELETFQDASTLWLTDALVAQGAQVTGARRKFNQTTVVHTKVFRDFISESVVRHATYESAIGVIQVGGDPALVRSLSSTEYAALSYVFNNRLTADLKADLVADENGIRGNVLPEELGIHPEELQYETERTASTLGGWLNPACQ